MNGAERTSSIGKADKLEARGGPVLEFTPFKFQRIGAVEPTRVMMGVKGNRGRHEMAAGSSEYHTGCIQRDGRVRDRRVVGMIGTRHRGGRGQIKARE